MGNLKGSRIVVTGGAGFLGQAVCAALRQYEPADIFTSSTDNTAAVAVCDTATITAHQTADIGLSTDRAGAVTVVDAAVVVAHKATDTAIDSIDIHCFQSQIGNHPFGA